MRTVFLDNEIRLIPTSKLEENIISKVYQVKSERKTILFERVDDGDSFYLVAKD